MKKKIVDLYADGGVIQKNPSTAGGTYAYVLVCGDRTIHHESGVYTPKDMGTDVVTNNQMELLSILIGMQYANGQGMEVNRIYSDSQITLGRLYNCWSLKNIPVWMVELFHSLRPIIHKTKGEFIKGHNGHKWNELCDNLCRSEAERFRV